MVMPVYTTSKTTPIDPAATMKELGIYASRAGFVTLDQPFTQPGSTFAEMAKFIRAGTAGDILLQNKDGVVSYHPNVAAGIMLNFVCKTVISSYDFGGTIGVKTTTATEITWLGGQ